MSDTFPHIRGYRDQSEYSLQLSVNLSFEFEWVKPCRAEPLGGSAIYNVIDTIYVYYYSGSCPSYSVTTARVRYIS